MASNLLIAYPDIPFRASAITPSTPFSTALPITNSINKERHRGTEIAGVIDSANVQFDLGVGHASQAQYLIIAGAKRLKAQGVTGLYLSGHNGGSETTVVGLGSTFQSGSMLSGAQGKDFIAASGFNNVLGLTTTAFRYWKLYMGAPTAQKFGFLKAYFGMFFDMGRDPSYPSGMDIPASSENAAEPGYTFKLKWEGVSDAKALAFKNSIFNLRDINPVFLYTASVHGFLNGWRLVHCQIRSGSFEARTINSNVVTVEFEVLG